jgi:hypothetical protein
MIPQTPIYRNVRKLEKFVISLCLRTPIRRSIVACLAFVTVCALFLLTTVNVQASTVTIKDQAGVLDSGRVQAEAEQLPILIFTTKTFTGDKDAFNQYTREQLPNQDSIAIGIDTVHVTISIEAGAHVQLSNSQANDAYSAAVSNYESGGGYTGATIAAIDSLKGAMGHGGMTPLGVAVLILLGLVVVGLIVIAKRWRRRDDSDRDPRIWNPYYGGIYPTGTPPSAYYGGSDGGASGSFGGGAGGSSGGDSSGGGAGGHL